jgi:hypothetical protein
MMRYLTWLNIALCLCFTGCNRAALVKKVVPQEDEVFARKYVELLRQRAFDQIEPKLDPSISAFEVRKALESMADVFPAEEPKSTKVVAYNLHHSLTLEYEFPDRNTYAISNRNKYALLAHSRVANSGAHAACSSPLPCTIFHFTV